MMPYAMLAFSLINEPAHAQTGIDPATLSVIEAACRSGNLALCVQLAEAHLYGRGLPADTARAKEYYAVACELKDERSCATFGALAALGSSPTPAAESASSPSTSPPAAPSEKPPPDPEKARRTRAIIATALTTASVATTMWSVSDTSPETCFAASASTSILRQAGSAFNTGGVPPFDLDYSSCRFTRGGPELQPKIRRLVDGALASLTMAFSAMKDPCQLATAMAVTDYVRVGFDRVVNEIAEPDGRLRLRALELTPCATD